MARAEQGRQIDPSALAPIEASFGRSFAEVRLHEGPAVDTAAHAMGTAAFTAGDHVYVHSKVPAETPAGREILGEELAHVAQGVGTGGGVDRLLETEGAVEREAQKAAAAAAAGERADIGPRPDVGVSAGRFDDRDEVWATAPSKDQAEAAQKAAPTADPDAPSPEQLASLKNGALPPLNAIINKLTAEKGKVVPSKAAQAATNLGDIIQAQASPSGAGMVNMAADFARMGTTTLWGPAAGDKVIAGVATRLRRTATSLEALVKGGQELPKPKEGEANVEAQVLSPAQVASLEAGAIRQILKVVEMLGATDLDFDLS